MSDFPKNLLTSPSGFPDLLPNEAIAMNKMLDIIKRHYESAGFSPIETPLVERTEVLTAKSEGEINTQMYGLRLMNPSDNSPTDSKDLVLRFDQTVPLARYVVAHQREIAFPFRRYVIGPVFRGEKPKEGRYRQFIQADIDVIGDGTLDTLHDAEAISVINNIFEEIDIGSFTIRIGNRKVLNGILKSTGINNEQANAAQAIIDRIDKVSQSDTIFGLMRCGLSEEAAKETLSLLTKKCPCKDLIADLKKLSYGEEFNLGVLELEQIINGAVALGIPEKNYLLDLSIARGLEYYTGNVYETFLDDYKELGSIASGGRYENLAGSFTNKALPGVGISIGVTRLLLKLLKAGLVKGDTSTVAPVIITTALPLQSHGTIYLEQAKRLRDCGINTEVYLTDRALGKELEYANKKGFKIAIITSNNELENETVIVRNLMSGEQEEVENDSLTQTVTSMLNSINS